MIIRQRENKLSDKNREVKILNFGKNKIDKVTVGYLKYEFPNSRRERSYGLEIFFCNGRGFFYVIEISSVTKPIDKFSQIADSIFHSMAINFRKD